MLSLQISAIVLLWLNQNDIIQNKKIFNFTRHAVEKREKILELLQQNARLTASEISDRLNFDVDEIESTIKRCETENIIRGYYTLINEDNYHVKKVRALIEVSVRPERDGGFDRVARNIGKFSEVTDVMLISGNCDLQLIVVGESLNEVANFVAQKLAPLDGVLSTRTHFMLKKYKEAGFQFEDDEDYERLKITP